MSTYDMRSNIIFFMEFFALLMIIIILVYLLACLVITFKKIFILSDLVQKENIDNKNWENDRKCVQAKKRKHNAVMNEADYNDTKENNQVLQNRQEDYNCDFQQSGVEADDEIEYYPLDRLASTEQEEYCYTQEDLFHQAHNMLRIGLEYPGMPKTIDKLQKLIKREDGELIVIDEDSRFYYVMPYDVSITEKDYDGTAIKECFEISQNIQGGKQYKIMEGKRCKIMKKNLSIVERGYLQIAIKSF